MKMVLCNYFLLLSQFKKKKKEKEKKGKFEREEEKNTQLGKGTQLQESPFDLKKKKRQAPSILITWFYSNENHFHIGINKTDIFVRNLVSYHRKKSSSGIYFTSY
jgi:hypothetical protein